MDIIKVVNLDINRVVPDPDNARLHDDRNIRAIAGSLEKFGQQKPIVIDGDYRVIAGNGTVSAAQSLGWKKIQAVKTELTGDEARAFALADNRTAELAEWDDRILKVQLGELLKVDFDIEAIGFDVPGAEGAGTEGLTDPDEVPEVPQNVFNVKRGEIWQLGDHRLMCGDSTDKVDVDRLMGGSNAVFCFTSPPYVDMRDYGGADLTLEKIVQFIDSSACDFYAVNLGLSRKDGVINPYWNAYIEQANKQGLGLTAWNVWSREGRGGSIANMSAMFPVEHEWIFVFGGNKDRVNRTKKNKTAGLHKGISNRQKDGSTKKTDPKIVREYGRMGSVTNCCYATGTSKIDHPAMFPVELAEKYIDACSNKSEWIYEPFCGSGSTLIACEKTGRKCYGSEIDPHYCSVIIKRWQDFTGREAQLAEGQAKA